MELFDTPKDFDQKFALQAKELKCQKKLSAKQSHDRDSQKGETFHKFSVVIYPVSIRVTAK